MSGSVVVRTKPGETITESEDPARYYSECWVARFRRGHNPRSRAIHYGIHDVTEIDAEDAKLRLNTHVADRLQLVPSRPASILDLGCGVGGTIADLARQRPQWSFCGVDLTPQSLALASEHASEADVVDRVRWIHSDYARTGLLEFFDGAYAIESACHATHRAGLVREVFRLLQPGAAFVVVDFFRTERAVDGEAACSYERLKRGFAIADYYDADLGAQLLEQGFVNVDTVDLTEQVRPATRRSAQRARAALVEDRALTALMRFHLEACLAVEDLCASGHLAYRSVRAFRPTG